MKHPIENKGSITRKDAIILKEFLKKEFPKGFVSSRELLEKARPKNSSIHHMFEWDDGRAAEKYRLFQAGHMIRCLVVEIGDNQIRAYCPPVYVGNVEKYIELQTAMKSPDIWRQVLGGAMRDAELWHARYSHYEELKPISKAIMRVKKEIGVKSEKSKN